MGVPISVLALQLCNTSVSGPNEYADGCLFEKRADWYPLCLGGGTGFGGWGPLRDVHPKKYTCLTKTIPVCQYNFISGASWGAPEFQRATFTQQKNYLLCTNFLFMHDGGQTHQVKHMFLRIMRMQVCNGHQH